MYKYIFIDTETTGLLKEDKICQIAYSFKTIPHTNYGNFSLSTTRIIRNKLVNPQISISPEAAMTTGITNHIVKDSPTFFNTLEYKELQHLSTEKNNFFIAYNAPFDIDMLNKDGININENQIIDLYRIAKHLYKNETIKDRNGDKVPLSNNKLQYFRYLLDFDIQDDFLDLMKDYKINSISAHDALGDIVVLEYFFYYLQKTFNLSFEDMIELSNTPVLEPNINFGNVFEKGKPFSECLTETYEQYGKIKNGYDYLDWCSSNLTLSVDTEYSVKRHFFNHLINGDIPYNNNFLKYINYGLVFEENPQNIEKGLEIIGQSFDYIEGLKNKFIQSMDKKYTDNMDNELGDWFPYYFIKRTVERTITTTEETKELEI